MIAGLDKAGMIFNLVFFISLTSVLVQGTTLPVVARWLRLIEKDKPVAPVEKAEDSFVNDTKEFVVTKESSAIGKNIFELHLPASVLVLTILRNNEYIQPTGATIIKEGDRIVILSRNKEDLMNFL